MKLENRVVEPLWEDMPPMALGENSGDIPTICAYYPIHWKNNHKAVIVFPGGGYTHLAEHEGHGYAEFLAENGYNAFVVKYRLSADHYHHPAQISDAARAVRVIRSNAERLKIDPNKIGVMGSSAGGHLAACCSNIYFEGLFSKNEKQDVELGRPDFAILCYPVISGVITAKHAGSFEQLLGDQISEENLAKLSMELRVTEKTPKTFLFHTFEDKSVPVENSLLYAMKLKECGVPFDLHVFEVGPHGIGLAQNHPWSQECLRFLATI